MTIILECYNNLLLGLKDLVQLSISSITRFSAAGGGGRTVSEVSLLMHSSGNKPG